MEIRMDLKPLTKAIAFTTLSAAVLAPSLAQAAFIEDTKASLTMKNFYINNDNRDGGVDDKQWGQGFILNVQSGFTEGTVGFGLDAVAMWGIKLDDSSTSSKNGRGSSQLFPTKSNGHATDDFAKLGVTAKARISKSEARVGTLQPNLPILKSNDGRLLPQMFNGGQITMNEIENLSVVAGLLNNAVGRASSNRTGLSVAGGKEDSNKFWFAGADYKVMPDLTLQYYYANLEDFYKQNFLGLNHTFNIADNQSFNTDVRYFRTKADGNNKSVAGRAAGYSTGGYTKTSIQNNKGEYASNGKIDNNTWSLAFTYKIDKHSIMLGHQRVSKNSDFTQLNQGGLGEGAQGASVWLHTDRLINNFAGAGTKSSWVDYKYDFAGVGVPGLKAGVSYTKGTSMYYRDKNGTVGKGKQWERDFAADYTIQEGTFKNLTFSWRNGMLRGHNAQASQDHNRLYVTYTLPLL